MMKCKKCDKDIQGEEFKMVAEWIFCADCFETLMRKPPEKEKPEKDDPEEIPEWQAGILCQACKKEIPDGGLRKLGIWELCPACYEILVFRPKQTVNDEKDQNDSEDTAENKNENEVPIDLTQSVECGACGRTIPLGGGKQLNGKILCPECHLKCTGEKLSMGGETGNRNFCDACGRELRAESLRDIEGFSICQACLSADSETALRIAQERHRRKLLLIDKDLAD